MILNEQIKFTLSIFELIMLSLWRSVRNKDIFWSKHYESPTITHRAAKLLKQQVQLCLCA